MKIIRRAIRILVLIPVAVAGLVILLFFFLNISDRFTTNQTNRILEKSNVPVHIGSIRTILPQRVIAEEVTIRSRSLDTLIFAGKIDAGISLLRLLKEKVAINNLVLENARVTLSRVSDTVDLDIAGAFTPENRKRKDRPEPEKGNWEISIRKAVLSGIAFQMEDIPSGLFLEHRVKKGSLSHFLLSLENRGIEVTSADLVDYQGKVILSGAKKKVKKESSVPWSYGIRDARLQHLDFTFQDSGKSLMFRFGLHEGTFQIRNADIPKRVLDVENLKLIQPSATILTGISTRRESRQHSDFPWELSSNKVVLENAHLLMGGYPGTDDRIDKKDTEVSDLTLELSDLILTKENAGLLMETLQFETGDGFVLEKGRASVSSGISSVQASVAQQTGNSDLRIEGEAGGTLMELIRDPAGIGKGELHIQRSKFSLKDIGFFVKTFNDLTWFRKLSGQPLSLNGSLILADSRLDITETSVAQSENFSIQLQGSIAAPFEPSISNLNLNLNIPFIEGIWLQEMLSAFGLENTDIGLEKVTLAGTLTDSYRSTGFDLALESNLGNMGLAGKIEFGDQSYDLMSAAERLELGKLLSVEELGSFTGAGTIKGKGWDPSSLRATLDMKIDTLGYRDYNYTGTSITGSVQPEVYRISALMNDPNMQGSLEGELINSPDSTFSVDVIASLDGNLLPLNLSEDTLNINAEGEVKLLRGLHAIESDVNLSRLKMEAPWMEGELGALKVNFHSDTSWTSAMAEGDFIQLDAEIDISVDSLRSLKKSYSDYAISLVDTIAGNDTLRIDFLPDMYVQGNMKYHEILGILLQDTTLRFSNLDFSLFNDAAGNRVRYEVEGKDLVYKQLKTGDIELQLIDSAGMLDLSLDAFDNSFNDAIANRFSVHSTFADWKSLSTLALYDDRDQMLYYFEIASQLDSNLLMLSSPSREMVLNGESWQMEEPEMLSLNVSTRKFYPFLRIHQDSSVVELFSEETNEGMNYGLTMDNVAMSSILAEEVITGNPSGLLDGSLLYRPRENGDRSVEAALQLDQIRWSELEFDRINVDGTLTSSQNGNYMADLKVAIDTSELIFSGKREDTITHQFHAQASSFPVKVMHPFVREYISDLSGRISGQFNATIGKPGNELSGGLIISDAGMRVIPLNALFKIPGDTISFRNRRLVMNRFTVLDSLDNKLQVNGYVDFGEEGDVTTNLDISSSRLQVMNRSQGDDASFYGSAVVDAQLRLQGPLDNPSINGRIMLNRGSNLYYRHTEDLSVSETEKVVRFVDYSGEEMKVESQPLPPFGMLRRNSIETEVEIDPSTRLNFYVSKQIYSIDIVIQGGGVLNYQKLSNNQSLLSGRYVISDGDAALKLVGWPVKSFQIEEEGYVRWDGPVEDPDLRFVAVNKVRTSYVNPVDGQPRDVDFNVVLQLTNRLSDLEVLFTINTPDQYLMSIINTLSPEERMRQAVTVLLFERVDLPGISTSSDYMTAQVNQLVASSLNQITKTTIQGVDISFGIDSYVAATEGGGQQTKTSLSYEVRKGLLNDRAQIEVSGRLNDLYSQARASHHSLNNITFEYRIDSVGTKFFKAYNKHVYEDVFVGEVISTGVGISFRKRYSTFGEIWRRDQEKKKNKDSR